MTIATMLDLNTVHMPNSEPDFGKLRFAENEFGYVVWCIGDSSPLRDAIPSWLAPIMDEANAKGCMLINFDSAADVDSQFRIYDW